MKPFDVVMYTVYAIVAFAVYFIAVPALISAKSTLAVVAGCLLVVAAAVYVTYYVIKTFNQKENVENE